MAVRKIAFLLMFVLLISSLLYLSSGKTSAVILHQALADRCYNSQHFGSAPSNEELPPIPIDHRCASLFVTARPFLVLTNNPQNESVTFTLLDGSTGKTLPHTTFEITMSAFDDSTIFLHDIFHSHSGNWTLNIQPDSYADSAIIYGNRDLNLSNAVVAGSNDTVNVKSSIFLKRAAIHIHTMVLGIGNDTLFPATSDLDSKESAVHTGFDSYISVGTMYPVLIPYNNNESYNSTIITFTNKITNITYDNETKTLIWSMPFDYNLTTIKNSRAFVHEEVRIPKSIAGLYNYSGRNNVSVNATVNGISVSGSRHLAEDPYSFKNAFVFHYIITTNDLVSIAQNMQDNDTNNDNSMMTFTLSQSVVVPEFGSRVAGLVMAVAIVGVIAASVKFRGHSNFV